MTEITLTFWKLLCITKSMNWNCTGSQIHLKKKLCGFTKKQSSTYFITAYIYHSPECSVQAWFFLGGGSLSQTVNQEVRWGGGRSNDHFLWCLL